MIQIRTKYIASAIKDVREQVEALRREGIDRKDALNIMEVVYISLMFDCLLDMVINGIHREG